MHVSERACYAPCDLKTASKLHAKCSPPKFVLGGRKFSPQKGLPPDEEPIFFEGDDDATEQRSVNKRASLFLTETGRGIQ